LTEISGFLPKKTKKTIFWGKMGLGISKMVKKGLKRAIFGHFLTTFFKFLPKKSQNSKKSPMKIGTEPAKLPVFMKNLKKKFGLLGSPNFSNFRKMIKNSQF